MMTFLAGFLFGVIVATVGMVAYYTKQLEECDLDLEYERRKLARLEKKRSKSKGGGAP